MAATVNFSSMDEEQFKAFHWRVLLTTGMGVFCDGYDLSSIGIVLPLVLASFGVPTLTGLQSGLLVGSALFGSAVGALIFGLLAQYGRKRFYGIDVLIMGLAAIAQAFAPSLAWLIGIDSFWVSASVAIMFYRPPSWLNTQIEWIGARSLD